MEWWGGMGVYLVLEGVLLDLESVGLVVVELLPPFELVLEFRDLDSRSTDSELSCAGARSRWPACTRRC